MADRELSPCAAARKLGMNVKTVRALCDDGKVEHRVVRGPKGRRIYIPVSEIQRIRASQKKGRIDRIDQTHPRQNH